MCGGGGKGPAPAPAPTPASAPVMAIEDSGGPVKRATKSGSQEKMTKRDLRTSMSVTGANVGGDGRSGLYIPPTKA